MRLKRERERERKAGYYNLIRKVRIVEGQSEMKRVERSWAGETYWRGKDERVDLKAMLVDIRTRETNGYSNGSKKKNKRMEDNVSVIYRK